MLVELFFFRILKEATFVLEMLLLEVFFLLLVSLPLTTTAQPEAGRGPKIEEKKFKERKRIRKTRQKLSQNKMRKMKERKRFEQKN